MKTLRAGFFAGEFGWALMRWQGVLRHKAKKYDKVVVGCEKQYRFLYEDFATDFIDFPHKAKSRNMWYTNGKAYPMENANIVPSRTTCSNEAQQEFVKWGSFSKGYAFDILIHDRKTENMNTGYRNWHTTSWNNLVERYEGYTIASLGSTGGSGYVKGTVDIRGIELSKLVDIMASSKIIVGPSSGPMHLASLCGLKHIVWSDTNTIGVMDNKKRYTETWNPFKTECKFIPSWQPSC